MKTQTKAELRASLERLGSALNETTNENIRLRAKLAAYEKLAAIPVEEFRSRRYSVEVVRVPRPPRTA